MAIMEVVDNIKDGSKKVLGDNGFIIFLGGFGFLFLVIYLVQTKGSSQKITTATSVTSYPDTVTNANVIISTLQDSTDYAKNEILDAIDTGNAEVSSKIDTNFEATNGYIEQGLNNQQIMDDKLNTIGNVVGMTYYEQMLEQQREGFISGNYTNIMGTLKDAGIDYQHSLFGNYGYGTMTGNNFTTGEKVNADLTKEVTA